jgi:hypothetical protein
MTRAPQPNEFLGYRFEARFWGLLDGQAEIHNPYDPAGWAFSEVEHSEDGLEFFTAHRVGVPILYNLLREALVVEINIHDYTGKRRRSLTYRVGRPQALTIRLDAMADEPAVNGIIFKTAELVSLDEIATTEAMG